MILTVLYVVFGILLLAVILWFLLGMGIGIYASDARIDVMKHFPWPDDEETLRLEEDLRVNAQKLKSEVTREYEITNREGLRLHGYLIEAPEPSDVYVLYFHGYHSTYKAFECGQNHKLWEERGYNLFTADLRGHGQSEGKWITFGEHESADGMEWIRFLKETFGEHIRIILHGQSMGCATCLLMSGRADLPDNVRMILADCGYSDTFEEAVFMTHLPRPLAVPLARAAGVSLLLFAHTRMSLASPREAVRSARVPILFCHGLADGIVPDRMSRENYEACASAAKELVFYPGAAHAKSYASHPEEYRDHLFRFLEMNCPDL